MCQAPGWKHLHVPEGYRQVVVSYNPMEELEKKSLTQHNAQRHTGMSREGLLE